MTPIEWGADYPIDIPIDIARPQRSIVAFSSTRWHDQQWMSRHHICSRLAERGWQVVYSNGPLGVRQRHSERWAEAPWFDRVEQVGNLKIVHAGRLTAAVEKSSWLTKRAIRRHAKTVIDACQGMPDWLLVFSPRFADYVGLFAGAKVAYHAHDHFPGYKGWNAVHVRSHRALVETADVLTTTSAAIARDLPPPGPERAVVIPSGADSRAFELGECQPCPEDLAIIPSPRIIYTGTLNEKIDFELIATCARMRPQHQWILLGSEAKNLDKLPHVTELRRMPNVHFLGERHHAMVPTYVGHVDVAALAYRQKGGWVAHVSPQKLPEALAAGCPVVASPIAAVRPFASVVAIAANPGEWLDAIDNALAGNGVGTLDERRQRAREHDWDRCVERYESLLTAGSRDRVTGA